MLRNYDIVWCGLDNKETNSLPFMQLEYKVNYYVIPFKAYFYVIDPENLR